MVAHRRLLREERQTRAKAENEEAIKSNDLLYFSALHITLTGAANFDYKLSPLKSIETGNIHHLFPTTFFAAKALTIDQWRSIERYYTWGMGNVIDPSLFFEKWKHEMFWSARLSGQL